MPVDLITWNVVLKPEARTALDYLDKSVRIIILKKLMHMQQNLQSRGLKNHSEYKIEEVGSYRIVFIQDDKMRVKYVHLIAHHKEYDEWWKTLT